MRIVFTYASLNGLDIMVSGIQNAYLQSPISEKYWTICGPDFGPELQGCKAYIAQKLYQNCCAGRDFRQDHRECREILGYTSCLTYTYLCIRKVINDDGCEYYEYMLLCVDNCLCIYGQPQEAFEEVNRYFPMKAFSIGPANIYLGAKVGKLQLPNGVEAYAIIMSQHVQESVKNVDKYLHDRGIALFNKALTPLLANYSPTFGRSPELDEREADFYQSLIGIFRWMVEMGRLDICMEVSAMSSFVTIPREDHFQQMLHMFAYLKIHHNAQIMSDSS